MTQKEPDTLHHKEDLDREKISSHGLKAGHTGIMPFRKHRRFNELQHSAERIVTEVEYWYVEFNERFENVYEWTRKAVCIARHPSDWIKCKREFDDGVCEMTGNVRTLWEIVSANPITKDDYDIFMRKP